MDMVLGIQHNIKDKYDSLIIRRIQYKPFSSLEQCTIECHCWLWADNAG